MHSSTPRKKTQEIIFAGVKAWPNAALDYQFTMDELKRWQERNRDDI